MVLTKASVRSVLEILLESNSSFLKTARILFNKHSITMKTSLHE